jgi:hypothetical protein
MCDIIMDDKNSLTMVNVECDVKITSRQISQEGAHELKADWILKDYNIKLYDVISILINEWYFGFSSRPLID